MDIKKLLNSATKIVFQYCKTNAPKLLTGLGLGLGAGTVVYVYKKSPEAHERKEQAIAKAKEEGKGKVGTAVEVVKATAPVMWPAYTMGAGAAACLIGSNKISADRLATMTAAYSVLQDKLENYKETAKEVLGDAKALL